MNNDIIELLPHRPPMLLVHDYDQVDLINNSIVAYVHTSTDDLFYDKELQGIPPAIAIEYMAQTIGIFSGYRARANNLEKSDAGMLLSIRDAQLNTIPVNCTLQLFAQEVLTDGNMGVYNCRTEWNGQLIASAQLTVYKGLAS